MSTRLDFDRTDSNAVRTARICMRKCDRRILQESDYIGAARSLNRRSERLILVLPDLRDIGTALDAIGCGCNFCVWIRSGRGLGDKAIAAILFGDRFREAAAGDGKVAGGCACILLNCTGDSAALYDDIGAVVTGLRSHVQRIAIIHFRRNLCVSADCNRAAAGPAHNSSSNLSPLRVDVAAGDVYSGGCILTPAGLNTSRLMTGDKDLTAGNTNCSAIGCKNANRIRRINLNLAAFHGKGGGTLIIPNGNNLIGTCRSNRAAGHGKGTLIVYNNSGSTDVTGIEGQGSAVVEGGGIRRLNLARARIAAVIDRQLRAGLNRDHIVDIAGNRVAREVENNLLTLFDNDGSLGSLIREHRDRGLGAVGRDRRDGIGKGVVLHIADLGDGSHIRHDCIAAAILNDIIAFRNIGSRVTIERAAVDDYIVGAKDDVISSAAERAAIDGYGAAFVIYAIKAASNRYAGDDERTAIIKAAGTRAATDRNAAYRQRAAKVINDRGTVGTSGDGAILNGHFCILDIKRISTILRSITRIRHRDRLPVQIKGQVRADFKPIDTGISHELDRFVVLRHSNGCRKGGVLFIADSGNGSLAVLKGAEALGLLQTSGLGLGFFLGLFLDLFLDLALGLFLDLFLDLGLGLLDEKHIVGSSGVGRGLGGLFDDLLDDLFDASRGSLFDDLLDSLFDDSRGSLFDDLLDSLFDDSRGGLFDDNRRSFFGDLLDGLFDDSLLFLREELLRLREINPIRVRLAADGAIAVLEGVSLAWDRIPSDFLAFLIIICNTPVFGARRAVILRPGVPFGRFRKCRRRNERQAHAHYQYH